jgi:hypothetical protein
MAAISIDIEEALLRRAQEDAVACESSSFATFVTSILIKRQVPCPAMPRVSEHKFEEITCTAAGLDM